MGLTKYERRVTRIQQQLDSLAAGTTIPEAEISDESSPELHHVMRCLPCNVFDLASFLRENSSDPAVKVSKEFFGPSNSHSPQDFIPKMKDHLLSRLHGYEYDGDERSFTDDERNDLRIIGGLNRIIQSTVLRINYTTYDICRGQDVLRPGPKCFVFTLSREDGPDAHPFWYAQVLRALHVEVLHTGPHARCRSPQTMELLWVRWLGVEPKYRWGFRKARLPKVGFVPESDDNHQQNSLFRPQMLQVHMPMCTSVQTVQTPPTLSKSSHTSVQVCMACTDFNQLCPSPCRYLLLYYTQKL